MSSPRTLCLPGLGLLAGTRPGTRNAAFYGDGRQREPEQGRGAVQILILGQRAASAGQRPEGLGYRGQRRQVVIHAS